MRAKIHFHQTTTLTPEQYVAGLTDFGPGRSNHFGNSADEYLKVHHLGRTDADVTEGSGGIWERLHYDWSDPETVRWTVRRSNFCAPGSYVSATITPRAGGGSHIHVTWNRTPTSLIGKISTLGIRLTRGMPVKASMQLGLAKLEGGGKAQGRSTTT